MVGGSGFQLKYCHIDNLHSINIHYVFRSGVARAVGLILFKTKTKPEMCSCTVCLEHRTKHYCIINVMHSSMTHLLIGHNDGVEVSGDTDDGKLTRQDLR